MYDENHETQCFHISFLVVDQRASRGSGEAQATIAGSRNAFWKRNDSGAVTGKREINGGSVFDLGTKRKTNGAYSSGICLVFNQNSCKLCFFAARQHSFILLEISKGRYIGQKNFMASFIRDHSFSTYANFFQKTNISYPTDIHTHVCVSGRS